MESLPASAWMDRRILRGLSPRDGDERERISVESGRDAGGQVGNDGHLPERSAAIFVVSEPDHADIDARVDLHPEAVRRCLD